jgi:hypothetical protein
MHWKDFIQKANSEDNGNPSQRRTNVFLACTLFSIGIFIAYFVVIFWIPQLLMEMTTALLIWITTALGLGIVAKTKEQKVSAEELKVLRESEIKTPEDKPPVQT